MTLRERARGLRLWGWFALVLAVLAIIFDWSDIAFWALILIVEINWVGAYVLEAIYSNERPR